MPTRVHPGQQAVAAGGGLAPALQQRLVDAEALCRQRGSQLTARRREVLELLLRRNGTAKAYDLQDDMRARHGRVAPTTVYRALDFLMDQGLVHRVDAVNSFVACNRGEAGHPPGHPPGHHTLMVVCARCGAVAELHDHDAMAAITQRLRSGVPGFVQAGVEIKGLCAGCVGPGAQSGAGADPGPDPGRVPPPG